MNDPYRSENQVAKLQAENEKLQREKDELMVRFGMLKKWPAFISALLVGMVCGAVNVFVGSMIPTESHKLLISHQDRRAIVDGVSKRVSADVSVSLQENLQAIIRTELDRQNVPRREEVRPRSQNQPAQDVLVLGQVVRGRIHSKSGYRQEPIADWWRFNARAGDTVIFRMKRVSGNLDPNITLYAPDGRQVDHDSNSGDGHNASLVYRFTSDGQYMIEAISLTWNERNVNWDLKGSGNYTLSARIYNR